MILSGNEIAESIRSETKKQIVRYNLHPRLAVILADNNPASEIYVARKHAAAHDVGIETEIVRPTTPTTNLLISLINTLNERSDINAILVQLPLPKHIDVNTVISSIDPQKDVDGFHPENILKFMADKNVHTPVLIGAILTILDKTKEDLRDKTALIIGKSDVFLSPLAHALQRLGLCAEWIHSENDDLKKKALAADVLISAIGRPRAISGDMVKQNAIVIDIGMNRLTDGRVIGDVCFDEAINHAKWITPTPGGVGPVTVAQAMWNTTELALRQSRAN